MTKTTGGCFEVVDFDSSALFRFVATTVKESEEWVEKLKGESLKEANLDMGSICSSCSSSSYGSHPSPDATSSNDFSSLGGSFTTNGNSANSSHSPIVRKHHRSESYTDALMTSSDRQLLAHNNNNKSSIPRPSRLFSNDQTFITPTYQDGNSPNGGPLRHTRAQPHLGVNIHIVDKSRPTLDNILVQRQMSEPNSRSTLPLSEFFVNLPDS